MKTVCAARICKYSSEIEDSTDVTFINFPNDDSSKIWAHHCGREDLLMKSNEELHSNYHVCSHHIEDRYYRTRSVFDRDEQIESAENVVLSYCDMDIEIDQYRDISMKFSDLCRICGESSSDSIEIFSPKGMKLKLKEKINLHLPIKVDMEDLMPLKLCLNCYNKLEIVHSLVVASLKTDMRLKRFMNINEELNYDHRYSGIAKKYFMEITEEMCMREASDVTSVQLSSDKVEGIMSQEISFTNDLRREGQPNLNELLESQDEGNETESYPENEATMSNEIHPIRCDDTFKRRETFEDHEISFTEEEAQKKEKTENRASTRESSDVKFVEHKISCKLHQDEQYEICNVARDSCKIYKDAYDANNIVLMETNKRCGHCGSLYSTKKELLNHISKYHDGRLLFKCIDCDRSFEKWSSLDVHEATHRVDKPYLCDLCGKSFKHSNNLRGHKRTHLDDSQKKRHVCDVCGNAFRSRFHLREHMNQHDGTKPYSCEKCSKAFCKRIQLRQHKLSHGLNHHVCPICGAAFNRKGNMNTHLKRHNSDGTYACSVCTRRCKSMSELKLHRKEHTQQDIIESIRRKSADKIVWQCESCERVFPTRSLLMNHKRTHEGNRTGVECDVCGKKLGSKSSLTYHKRSVHSKERPHVCQYCGESVVSREARLLHERIHTGERPYVCGVCNMEYKCSSNLSQHMKTHTGVKPYKCERCEKSFTRRGALHVHERVHTGVKPFVCGTCGRSFSQKSDMIKHGRTHEAKWLRCERCGEVFVKKKEILKHVASHEQNDPVMLELARVEVSRIPAYNVHSMPRRFQ
ncbi:zinc finger protein 271-like isoform X2 [Ceratina calcarata]|uniref:Zinc finger protein 271-like isoform X2 n=1 Tax=Ceratina calcarata TaxID=156304 RepID=A0AAJ7RWT7_9HYME|nr:zinc finger protein 271-like isoform X2 [Ceratina calcarata]